MTLLAVLGVMGLFALMAIFLVQAMLTRSCPKCYADTGRDEMIVPVVPGLKWWCPACQRFSDQGDLRKTGVSDR